jgi:hypothetical protein
LTIIWPEWRSELKAAGSYQEAKLYGLFIGVEAYSSNAPTLKGDEAAKRVRDIFSTLPNFADHRLITENLNKGISKERIKSAINELKEQMKPNDILVSYIAAHGGNNFFGTETTLTRGDEIVQISANREQNLTDDELYSYLRNLDDITKWTFLDVCESGGFWGNMNPFDEGDLEKLKKSAMLAAAKEGEDAFYSDEGIPLFAYSLEMGLSRNEKGYYRADFNEDGNLSFPEIGDWIKKFAEWNNYEGEVVFRMDFGDPVIFSSEMWDPVSEKTTDFDETLVAASSYLCIESVEAYPHTLWPPNNKMHSVNVSITVADNCDSEPICEIVSVTSNVSGTDLWEITGDLTVDLRAKRHGDEKSDQEYTIFLRCIDTLGNSSERAVIVSVPHDQGDS